MVADNIPSTLLIDSSGGIYAHDLETRQTARLVDFSVTFTDIAVTPLGGIYANSFSRLYDVDIDTGTLTSLRSFSSSANGMASDAAGRLYIGYQSASRIDVLNASTFEVERSIALPSGVGSAGDIMITGDTLYYTSTARQLITIDLTTDTVVSTVYHGLSAAYGLHELDGTMYAFSGDRVYTINLETGAVASQYELIDAQFNSVVYGAATAPVVRVEGTDAADTIIARFAGLTLDGGLGDDTVQGSNGSDTLIGDQGRDRLLGGTSEADLRDVIFGGDGDDYINGGYGNDELRGDGGNDTIEGGFGADTAIGGAGNDVLTGGALGDLLVGGDGFDFINGGFGFDRVNGGAGADKFFHLGVRDHGADWIQDYSAADGDVLMFGGAANTAVSDFLVQRAFTANAGVAGVAEIFVTQKSTGTVLWALVDGAAQSEINIQIGAQVFDLLA